MKHFCVVYKDSIFYHPRTIYMCVWSENCGSWVQYPIATGVTTTKYGARLWVERQIAKYVLDKHRVHYIEGKE